MVDNTLYHYGIKGQKWGERRFQFYDGTRTSLGKRRRNTIESYNNLTKEYSKVAKKTSINRKKEIFKEKSYNALESAALKAPAVISLANTGRNLVDKYKSKEKMRIKDIREYAQMGREALSFIYN